MKMADKLQMIDLKNEIEELLIKAADNSSIALLVELAESYDCDRLLMVCARMTTRKSSLLQKNFCAQLIKEKPNFVAALLVAFREQATPANPSVKRSFAFVENE